MPRVSPALPTAMALLLAAATAAAAPARPTQGQAHKRRVFGGARPAELLVPTRHDPRKAAPLLFVLHGYGGQGPGQLKYTGFTRVAEANGALLIAPNGTRDPKGRRFWNATDACCDRFGSKVDDVAYLARLIEEITAEWHVDPKRIYFFGHSNGGYMSYQMACHHADKIAAVASLAGVAQKRRDACRPRRPVSVLQIHGDRDRIVPYAAVDKQPGAVESTAHWAAYNGCDPKTLVPAGRLNLVAPPSQETLWQRYGGCPPGVSVDLWTLEGGRHIPRLRRNVASEVWKWMEAHARK